MPIKQTIQALREYFIGTRRRGHTTAMMKGALNTEGVIIIAAHHQQAELFRSEFGCQEVITLGSLHKLRGMSRPVVIDHHALAVVMDEAMGEIARREDQLREAATRLEIIAKDIKNTLPPCH